MNILVTGGAGFIGSSLAERLADLPDTCVIAVDNLLTGRRENVLSTDNLRFIDANVNDWNSISSIMLSTPFDFVFHYAAVVGVARTLAHPTWVLSDLDGIRHILELSKNTGVQRVFFSSSSEVYGEPVEIPQHEQRTPLNARLPYAVVKSAGECFCRAYQQTHGLAFTVLRLFNTYGPKQNCDFVITRFLDQALAGEDLTIHGDGEQTRTFCYIDDHVEFTTKMLLDGLFENDVVNVGHHEQISIRQLAELVLDVTGSSSKILHLPPLKEGDMMRRQPENARMRQTLGRDLISLEDGIRRILDYRQNTK